MLRREPHQVIVRLLRETARAAFIHHTRAPRVLNSFLDRELHEEIDGILPVSPEQVQRSFRGFRFLSRGEMPKDAVAGIGGIC